MANPSTREELKQYALRQLGKPVIEINVDDQQLEDRLDEAYQFFAQYHYDGIRRTYLKYLFTEADKTRITANTSAETATKNSVSTDTLEGQNYIIVPDSIISVTNIFPFSDKSSMNLFEFAVGVADSVLFYCILLEALYLLACEVLGALLWYSFVLTYVNFRPTTCD